MSVNIDRLHEVLAVAPSEEAFGAGKTTAILYLLAGEAELGDPDNVYLIVTCTHAWALQVTEMFRNLLIEIGLEELIVPHLDPNMSRPTMITLKDGKRFIFMESNALSHWRGFQLADVYFDTGPYYWREYLSPDEINMISTSLVPGRTLNDDSNFTKK